MGKTARVKRCSRLRAIKNKRGFSVLEILIVTALVMAIATLVMPSIVRFSERLEYIVARNMAYALASDLRRTQSLDLYRTQSLYVVNFDNVQKSYYLSQNNRIVEKVKFAGYLNDWVLEASNAQNIFYATGALNSYNYINIYPYKQMSKGYQVQVLPVTGRVGVQRKQ